MNVYDALFVYMILGLFLLKIQPQRQDDEIATKIENRIVEIIGDSLSIVLLGI